MSAPPTTPVSLTLEADLRAVVRKHGVVAWLDADGHFIGFIACLAATRTEGDDARRRGVEVMIQYPCRIDTFVLSR